MQVFLRPAHDGTCNPNDRPNSMPIYLRRSMGQATLLNLKRPRPLTLLSLLFLMTYTVSAGYRPGYLRVYVAGLDFLEGSREPLGISIATNEGVLRHEPMETPSSPSSVVTCFLSFSNARSISFNIDPGDGFSTSEGVRHWLLTPISPINPYWTL